MENEILIKKKYLIFREDAKKLAKEIKKRNFQKVFVDFSQVSFMSRSFIDELLNQLKLLESKDKKVKFLNLNPSLAKFIFQVKKTKEKIQKVFIEQLK